MTDIEEKIEALATAIDESWRKNGAMNCTEVCAFVRTLKTTLMSAAEPVAKQYRVESSEGGTGWRPENDEMHMWWKDLEKRHPGSVTFYYRNLYAAPPAPSVAVKADLPERFEEWWTGRDSKGEKTLNYNQRKQLAWDAFHAAALSAQVQDVATAAEFADKMLNLNWFMLAEDYRGNPAVTITFPDNEERNQFYSAIVELSTHKTAAAPAKQDDKEPPICGTTSAHDDSYDAS